MPAHWVTAAISGNTRLSNRFTVYIHTDCGTRTARVVKKVVNWGRVVKNLYLLKETLGGTCKPVKTQLFRASSIPLHNEPGTSYIPHISQHYNRHQGTGLWELELYGAVLQCHHCDTRQGVYINFCTVINSSVHCNITGMHSYLMLYKQVLYI